MSNTDENFLADIEARYGPDFDWDSVPDPETLPDVYEVSGRLKNGGRFCVEEEYPSMEAAQAQIERMKVDPDWAHANLTFKIVAHKPHADVDRWIDRLWLMDIRAGKKVFPIYGP